MKISEDEIETPKKKSNNIHINSLVNKQSFNQNFQFENTINENYKNFYQSSIPSPIPNSTYYYAKLIQCLNPKKNSDLLMESKCNKQYNNKI